MTLQALIKRILGAIFVVALLVIILPFLLGEPENVNEVSKNQINANFSLQLATFSKEQNAITLKQSLLSKGYFSYIKVEDGQQNVFVGDFPTEQDALSTQKQIKNILKLDSLIIKNEL